MNTRCYLVVLISCFCICASAATPVAVAQLVIGSGKTQSSQPGQGKPRASNGSQSRNTDTEHWRGTLVEGGAECQRFRASDNKFYTLSGNLRGFHTGDEVEITGTTPPVSHCMQDITIQVQTIQRAKPSTSLTR